MRNECNMTNESSLEGNCFIDDPASLKIIRSCAYCVLILFSLVGNYVIIAATRRIKPTRRKTIDLFVVNMAMADICLTMYMPRMISLANAGYEWQVEGIAGQVFCRISTLLSQTCVAVSIFTVVAVSFDRFFAVVFPLRLPLLTPTRTKLLIVFIWLFSVVIRFPLVYSVEVKTVNEKSQCYVLLDKHFGGGTQKLYYFLNLICLFAAPFLVILILYSAIIMSLKRRQLPRPDNVKNSWQRRKEETTRKVLRMVSAVVAAFVLCWLLYFIRLILYSYGADFPCNLLFVRLFLAHLNSAINPFLYVVFCDKYRRSVKKIFASLSCTRSVCGATDSFVPATTAYATKTCPHGNGIHDNEITSQERYLTTKL